LYLDRVNFAVIGSSVQGEPVVYIAGFVVLLLLAFARPWAESVVALALVGGFTLAAVLIGSGVSNLQITESEKGPPGAGIAADAHGGLGVFLIGLIGFLTAPLLGLVGVYLVLAGQAWSLLWVVLVLLFVAYLKAKGAFTIVVVLFIGAGIGWVAVQGSPEVQAGVAVGLVWLLLLGGVSLLSE